MSQESIAFIEGKLVDAEKRLEFRVEAEACWRGGTRKQWRAVNCNLTKAARLRQAEIHGRIAVKIRTEIESFKAVLDLLRKGAEGKG